MYEIVLAATVLLSPLTKKKVKINKYIYDGSTCYLTIFAVLFIFLATARDYSVGIDTPMYQYAFEQVYKKDLLDVVLQYKWGDSEVGYQVFEWFIGRSFGNFRVLLFLESTLYVMGVFTVVKKYSKNVSFSVVLFLALGYYTESLYLLRQFMAMGICMFSVKLADEQKLVKFLVMIFIATLLHSTAVIFIPIYSFFYLTRKVKINDDIKIKKVRKYLFILLAFLIICNIMGTRIFIFLAKYSRMQYSFGSESNGQLMNLYFIISALIGIIYIEKLIKREQINTVLLICAIVSACIYSVTRFTGGANRLSYFYSIFTVLYIPHIVSSINDKIIRYIVLCGYVAIAIYYFFFIACAINNVSPYRFGF